MSDLTLKQLEDDIQTLRSDFVSTSCRFNNDLAVFKSDLHEREHLDLERYEHPDCWTPVTLETKSNKLAWEVQAWLRATAPGRYDVTYNWKGVTVFFETIADAVAFKLRWGGAVL